MLQELLGNFFRETEFSGLQFATNESDKFSASDSGLGNFSLATRWKRFSKEDSKNSDELAGFSISNKWQKFNQPEQLDDNLEKFTLATRWDEFASGKCKPLKEHVEKSSDSHDLKELTLARKWEAHTRAFTEAKHEIIEEEKENEESNVFAETKREIKVHGNQNPSLLVTLSLFK